MSAKTKTTIATIFVFMLAIAGLALRHVKPLFPVERTVLYTETEDFQSNGTAYAPVFRSGLLYLHLPNAKDGHRWWVVNYNAKTVTEAERPVSIFTIKLVLRKNFYGIRKRSTGEPIGLSILFSGREVSFSGNGLTCIVKQR